MDRYTLIPEFKKLIPQFLAQENVFGVYDSEDGKMVAALQERGYQVVVIESEIPKTINVLYIKTSPDKTIELVKAGLELDVKKVWLEPGSESQETIDYCQQNKIDLIYYHSLVKELTS